MKTNYIQYMTDQVNSPGDNIRYTSPQVKVLGVKMHHILCQSPGGSVGLWQNGSDTEGGDMTEGGNGW